MYSAPSSSRMYDVTRHIVAAFAKVSHYFRSFAQSLAREATREYKKVAEKHGLSLTQMALAYVQSRWFVTSTIIGATTLNQLKVSLSA